ncbi:hypothetical protein EOPP23_01730 [Endozoicomonas sp. OPT23]|uniref:alpha/beta fold hydrolase n=1 Tax=Endozoicomonas sp. OPT23 TaxID=2072845 RepID=UPI00129B17A3|nr:alpha/beta fold hydrolase [Endozoicomonas sp. OPT23]MRI31715.1 hypothetical protein [Endozoicomonas sp. OPT23]
MNTLPIVLVSGWGMPASVMEPLAGALDGDGRASVVQLPGLVEEPGRKYDWQSMLQYLDLHLFETPVILIGWSMGGALASLYASQNPDKVAGLITLASNPCFVRNDDWAEAMLPQTFDSFYQGMKEAPAATVDQFATLCSMGNGNRKDVLQNLKKAIEFDMDLDSDILLQLLEMLGSSNVSSQLSDIRCPVVHYFGKQDALVPADVAGRVSRTFPAHRVELIDGGHCFFLDKDSGVIQQIADQVKRLCSRS